MTSNTILRIRFDRAAHLPVLVILAVSAAVFWGYVAFRPDSVTASPSPLEVSSPVLIHNFYLTPSIHNGASATSACASGYHMASIWEILDPSEMKYNPDLGFATDDSGYGPPTLASSAWVRTGFESNSSLIAHPGQPNCNAWTSASGESDGTYVYLRQNWSTNPHWFVWVTSTGRCTNTLRVWCVSDWPGNPIFLPLVKR
jgi:hypothetical protein